MHAVRKYFQAEIYIPFGLVEFMIVTGLMSLGAVCFSLLCLKRAHIQSVGACFKRLFQFSLKIIVLGVYRFSKSIPIHFQ
ncbi:hypothetical protein DX928_20485 [Bacillus swezeyi]|uniref:Uncharacterized protein n=1 Tax=Bacillus swezeyi TaxID=1925020 RepID=A0A5M8RVX4_9BACI|nr:hypothetical protein DX927_15080 [Bacillus swezeyi]KAA6473706.1 hypothetical protein DX928_20485 [Bacillus swezeyi]